jgi:hypothetical protein
MARSFPGSCSGARGAFNAFLGSNVASKADVELVRADLRQVQTEPDGRITAIDARITPLQWMMGLGFALTVAVLGKLPFGH